MAVAEAEHELSRLQWLATLPARERESFLDEAAARGDLSRAELERLILVDWSFLARPKQLPPGDDDWTFWYLLAGRGFGKTISAGQWAKREATSEPMRVALVAPTYGDVRGTMVEGETGLLSLFRAANEVDLLLGGSPEVAWNKSLFELTLANGSQLKGFSSERPDRLRGPQFHRAWCEELSSWRDAAKGDVEGTTWSNVKLSTRLGEHPRFAITSTPKPNKLTKAVLGIAAGLRLVQGTSYENRANLPESWWRQVIAPLEGTRTGLQEILAQLLEDVEGALWHKSQLDALRVPQAPKLSSVGVGVDPNASSSEAANNAGIVVAGRAGDMGYVLADRTVTRGGPRAWAQGAVDAYHEFEADWIVAEKNNGGEMVREMIRIVDPDVPVILVWASRGKRTRAEPVAALYHGVETNPDANPDQHARVRHVGAAAEFEEMEEEMRSWTPEMDSPDRMDALVWVLTKLMLTSQSRIVHGSSAVGRRIPGVGV